MPIDWNKVGDGLLQLAVAASAGAALYYVMQQQKQTAELRDHVGRLGLAMQQLAQARIQQATVAQQQQQAPQPAVSQPSAAYVPAAPQFAREPPEGPRVPPLPAVTTPAVTTDAEAQAAARITPAVLARLRPASH
jgi:hypothetical protein